MRGPRLLLVLLVLSALTLTVLDRTGGDEGRFGAVRRAADTVLGPAQRSVSGAFRSVGRALAGGDDGPVVARLERENARLRGRLRESEGLSRPAQELQRLLATRAVGDYPVVPARVVAVGGSLGFARTATLDAGSRDGVRSGQTVLTGDGLVGRTTRVGPFTSTVLLLVDPGFSVGGRLSRVGGVGFVRGDGTALLRYEIVDTQTQVRVGDVVTTTASDTFVPDVPIGRVTRVLAGQSALTRVAEVVPFVDARSLDLVGVVVGPVRTGTRASLAPR